eukprot:scaffold60834_cov44-Attheya_sp.AAC.3
MKVHEHTHELRLRSGVSYLDSDADKEFGVGEGEFNDLAELTDLFVEASNFGKADAAVVFAALHVKDGGVDFTG